MNKSVFALFLISLLVVAVPQVFGDDCLPIPEIIGTLPRYESGWSGGVTWHNDRIYEVTDSLGFAIIKDDVTGQQLGTVPFNGFDDIKDIAYDPWSDKFWIKGAGHFAVHQFNLTGGNALRSVSIGGFGFGIYVDPEEENVMWVGDPVYAQIRKVNLIDGTVLRTIYTTFNVRGVVRAGDYLWCTRASEIGQQGVLFKLDMDGNELCKYLLPQSKYWHDAGGMSLDDEGYLWLHGGKETAIYKYDIGYAPLGASGELNWYLPAGGTEKHDTYILVSNPNAEAATVNIEYVGPAGSLGSFNQAVAAQSRFTANMKDFAGVGTNRPEAGTIIRSTNEVGVIAERSMYWDKGAGPNGWRGGHNTIGLSTTGTEWLLAEGATHVFDEYVHVLNPGLTAANVTVEFVDGAGFTSQTSFVLPAKSVRGVHANQVDDGKGQLSAKVTSSAPVAVDRTMYWPKFIPPAPTPEPTSSTPSPTPEPTAMPTPESDPDEIDLASPANAVSQAWQDGHSTIGLREAADLWHFAEGATHIFDEYILVYNPGGLPAQVLFTFRDQFGSQWEHVTNVAAGQRYTVKVNNIVGYATQVSTRVVSTGGVPVLAERAMYRPKGDPDNWTLGHVTVGAVPAGRWHLPEGSTFQFDEYVLVFNTSTTQTANVKFSFMDAGGNVTQHVMAVAPMNRGTVKVNDLVPNNTQVSTGVSSDQPVIAERAMYWPKGGPWSGGHATIGYSR